MPFRDPAGQLAFALPLGWAYEAERSHLVTVYFTYWSAPDHTLAVGVIPTAAPAAAEPDRWYEALDAQAPGLLARTRCAGAPAALLEFEDEDPLRRLLLVRGARVDVRIEQVGDPPDPFRAICRGLDVPPNRLIPYFAQQEDVMQSLEAAVEAAAHGDWEAVLEPAARAYEAATSSYLWTLTGGAMLPEIPAVIASVDALILIGQCDASLARLRDAEQLALRALNTSEHLPLAPVRRAQMRDALLERLARAAAAQMAIAGEQAPARYPGPAAVAVTRAPAVERIGASLNEQQQYPAAVAAMELALADAAATLADINRSRAPRALPEQARAMLEGKGIEGAEQQLETAHALLDTAAIQELEHVARLLPQLGLARELANDTEGAIEANALGVTVAEALAERQRGEPPSIERERPDPRVPKAVALLQHAAALIDLSDEPRLAEAAELVAEADALLDELRHDGALRARSCRLGVAILRARGIEQGALELIDRGLAAAAREPKLAELDVIDLEAMRFQVAGRNDAAIAWLENVVAAPEGEGARDRLTRARHHVTLASALAEGGRGEDALASLAESARRAIEINPFGEEALHTFAVGSRLAPDRALGHALNEAAVAALDGRRLDFGDAELRVAFADSERRREVYADYIQRLLATGSANEAIAAADRSRARTLLETLAAPAGDAAPAPAPEKPALGGLEPRAVLGLCAGYVVDGSRTLLERRGTASPLDADDLVALVAELGVTALVLHPVHGRLALLVARPSGEVDAVYSPVSLGALLEASTEAAASLRIRSVARGSSSTSAPPGELEDALARLHDGIVAPVAELLEAGRPLVVVPYRETALVPFALLRERGGAPLVDTHPLSLAPSLATLRALRSRGEWRRPRPAHAYVAADPAIAERFSAAGLGPLSGARREAAELLAQLRRRGVGEEQIALVTGAAADEASYRNRARGCDLVHLACHATLNEPASASCLYLAAAGRADGQLLVAEIAQVGLADALVFLAACDTGQGRATADGVIGVARGFLEAGARAVVMSLWKVVDVASVALCGHFYRELLGGRTAAHALRRAMTLTRADLEAARIEDERGVVLDARDAYWAPFVLVGDATAIEYEAVSAPSPPPPP